MTLNHGASHVILGQLVSVQVDAICPPVCSLSISLFLGNVSISQSSVSWNDTFVSESLSLDILGWDLFLTIMVVCHIPSCDEGVLTLPSVHSLWRGTSWI